MSKNNHNFRVMQLKNKRRISSGALSKISVKSIVLPETYNNDDSTISYVKRVGGQVFQSYSMRDLDLAVEDNFAYYYLVSEMYPTSHDSEKIRSKVSGFDVAIYKTKLTEELTENPVAATGIKGFTANSKIVIVYSDFDFKEETYATGVRNFSMEIVPTIRYNTYALNKDFMAGTGSKSFGFSSVLYPYIYESITEKTTLTLKSFNIEIG